MKFWSIQGLVSYEEARKVQLDLVELRSAHQIQDTILFLEHSPVITRGRGLQWNAEPRPRHMPILSPLPREIEFSESERGGDLTFHGPGQLVCYPVCRLDRPGGFTTNRDVAGFIRHMESVLITYLLKQGLPAEAKAQATGVWIGQKKIASIGIAVKKWVSYHGFALNVINDLEPFQLISPCGFHPDTMTRLGDWIEVDPVHWRTELEQALASEILRFGLNTLSQENCPITKVEIHHLKTMMRDQIHSKDAAILSE